MSDLVEDIEDEIAVLFPPKPGGMVDRWRKEHAKRQAEEEEARNTSERVEERGYKAVKTVHLSPEVIAAIPITIPALTSALLLPLSPYRYRSTVNIVTPSVNGIQANPGAGHSLTYILPYPTSLESIVATYTNNSGGNESPNIQIQDTAGNVVAEIPYGTVSTATAVTMFASLGSFAQQSAGTNNAFMPLPALGIIPAGYKIVITALNAADTITSIGIMNSTMAILARDNGAAISSNGYTLTPGLPFTFLSRGLVQAYNPTSQPLTLSVLSEIYGPE